MSERRIQSEILLAAPRLGVRLWRFQTGKYQLPDGRWVASGFAGAADLWGYVVGSGRYVAVECKTPTGRATAQQLRFLDVVKKDGGIAGICRSVADFENLIRGA